MTILEPNGKLSQWIEEGTEYILLPGTGGEIWYKKGANLDVDTREYWNIP